MFPNATPSVYQSSACFVTYGTMGHVDPKQPPYRSRPWTDIASQEFISKVDLVVPQQYYDALHETLTQDSRQPRYSRVTMALGQVLQGSFFTNYVKTGDALMLSNGRGNGDRFTLQKGILKLYLERESFERAGMEGKPHGAKGNRGDKPRWIVSTDLTAPSMVPGKRGFERLHRACENVFNTPVQWLFCRTTQSVVNPDPLDEFQPVRLSAQPFVAKGFEVMDIKMEIPPSTLSNGDRQALEGAAADLYEWLCLVRLQSPRTAIDDKIDPYLSRYKAPAGDVGTTHGSINVCLIRWQGLISPHWFRGLVTDVIGVRAPAQWFSASATGFANDIAGTGNDLTLLCPSKSKGEYLMVATKNSD
ncbi:Ribonuclease P [Purpureocillium takamizusanense]|uniref:Ribonuclease P n=1 Tax=Purpureocillium takamizusanense TaxID=2060973 RepID=A0A9Q8VBQ9_9HYPO|nr:Ribonuclease P [Purpureocillium takamizusanense]UNI19206.1 Ribonuclease P [Purpureocillium takamizusanense]